MPISGLLVSLYQPLFQHHHHPHVCLFHSQEQKNKQLSEELACTSATLNELTFDREQLQEENGRLTDSLSKARDVLGKNIYFRARICIWSLVMAF